MWKEILKNLGALILGFILGIIVSIPSCNKETSVLYIPVHDTITIEKERIVEHTKPVNIYHIDTCYITKTGDTIRLDSLPITESIYQDTIKTDSTSAEITVKFHGFNAEIDSVGFIYNYFNKTETIIQKPKKIGLVWCIGPYIGFGGGINIPTGTLGYGPSVGICGSIGIGGIIK